MQEWQPNLPVHRENLLGFPTHSRNAPDRAVALAEKPQHEQQILSVRTPSERTVPVPRADGSASRPKYLARSTAIAGNDSDPSLIGMLPITLDIRDMFAVRRHRKCVGAGRKNPIGSSRIQVVPYHALEISLAVHAPGKKDVSFWPRSKPAARRSAKDFFRATSRDVHPVVKVSRTVFL